MCLNMWVYPHNVPFLWFLRSLNAPTQLYTNLLYYLILSSYANNDRFTWNIEHNDVSINLIDLVLDKAWNRSIFFPFLKVRISIITIIFLLFWAWLRLIIIIALLGILNIWWFSHCYFYSSVRVYLSNFWFFVYYCSYKY